MGDVIELRIGLVFWVWLLFRSESVVGMVWCVLKEWRVRNGCGIRLELGSWVRKSGVLLVSCV